MRGPALATLLVLALAGCGSVLQDHGSAAGRPSQAPLRPPVARYLQRLAGAQAELAAAEARIPRTPRTAAALARSISLLGNAIARLRGRLAVIDPPPRVAPLHRRLLRILALYARRLTSAAAGARDPARELAAAGELEASTLAAQQSLSRALAAITARLGAGRHGRAFGA